MRWRGRGKAFKGLRKNKRSGEGGFAESEGWKEEEEEELMKVLMARSWGDKEEEEEED